MFSFFLKKYTVTFHLKSGATIKFRCNDFKYTKNGNDLTGYEIVEGEGSVLYCRLDDISAITVDK